MSATIEKARANIQRWKADPVAFVRECFGVEPELWQLDVLNAFPHHQRFCLKGSKGIGKSTLAAWVGWNFLLTRSHPKVVATSISGDNLRDGLWTEMAKWQQKSPLLRKAFEWNAERIFAKDHPEDWWIAARQWSKSADPQQQADTLAGIHANNALFLVEEAGGIPDGVLAAAEAVLSSGGDTKLFMDGNPTKNSGPIYRACTKERHLWQVFEINGDPDNPKRSQRVSAQWAREQIEKWGRESDYVKVNVFGEFPNQASNQLIGINDVTQATLRTVGARDYVNDARVMGVDVARQGDDRTVICARQGPACFQMKVFRTPDLMEIAGQVSMAANKWKPHAIFIDIGMGAGVGDRLKQLGYSVSLVDFGKKALGSDPSLPKMSNRRVEMWWHMAQWVKNGGGCLPDDPELIAELTAPTYWHDDSNRLKLESKDDMRARGLPSPDKADALALTFAEPVVAPNMRDAHERYGIEAGRMIHEYDPFSETRT